MTRIGTLATAPRAGSVIIQFTGTVAGVGEHTVAGGGAGGASTWIWQAFTAVAVTVKGVAGGGVG